jgi:hypothetical protein
MKKAYIITYELHRPGQKYNMLIEKIHSYGTWAKLGGSEYIIITDQEAEKVRDYLREVLDSNDCIFVGALTTPLAWAGMTEEVSNWIRNHFR